MPDCEIARTSAKFCWIRLQGVGKTVQARVLAEPRPLGTKRAIQNGGF